MDPQMFRQNQSATLTICLLSRLCSHIPRRGVVLASHRHIHNPALPGLKQPRQPLLLPLVKNTNKTSVPDSIPLSASGVVSPHPIIMPKITYFLNSIRLQFIRYSTVLVHHRSSRHHLDGPMASKQIFEVGAV